MHGIAEYRYGKEDHGLVKDDYRKLKDDLTEGVRVCLVLIMAQPARVRVARGRWMDHTGEGV